MTRLIAAGSLLLAGCGTFEDTVLTAPPRIYGGVRRNGEGFGGKHSKSGYACLVIDMPFSFAADTALLPFTIPYGLIAGEGDK